MENNGEDLETGKEWKGQSQDHMAEAMWRGNGLAEISDRPGI